MAFDIERLKGMRDKILLARDTALAKARQYGADSEKQASSFHTRRAQALEEYAAALADAMAEIKSLRARKVSAFAPCTREEAYAYGVTIGMPKTAVDPWYDHFESNGWRVSGKTVMRDWKAAMRNGMRWWAAQKPHHARAMGATQKPENKEPEGFRAWMKEKYPEADPAIRWERVPDNIKREFEKR